MSECEKRRFIPFRLAFPPIPLLTWRPKLGRPRKRNFATTSVATTEGITASSTPVSGASVTAVKVQLKPASDVLAGALARAASQGTIHPLDTLKVRMQTKGRVLPGVIKPMQLPTSYSKGLNLIQVGQSVTSLYRGVIGAASGAGIAIGAYFAFYGVASNIISRRTDLSPAGVAFVSGGIAAAGSSVIKVPLAVCIRSVQAGVYNNVFHAASSIMKATGPRGLFTGFLPTVLEDVPDMAMKFAAYETLRSVRDRFCKGRKPSMHEDFAMGAISGALAAAATTPVDVIKTNMMCTAAMRPTMFSAAALIYSQGGHAAFFRGIGARALSNGVNSAVFFCFFEAIRTHFAKQGKEGVLAIAGEEGSQ